MLFLSSKSLSHFVMSKSSQEGFMNYSSVYSKRAQHHDATHSEKTTTTDERRGTIETGQYAVDDQGLPYNKLLFPFKLRQLLDDAEKTGNEGIVSWLAHGKAFKVHKPKEFAEGIMKKHFRQTQFKSFTRQLYHYGFGKVDSGGDRGAFYHPQFQRDDPSLCLSIERKNNKKSLFQDFKGIGHASGNKYQISGGRNNQEHSRPEKDKSIFDMQEQEDRREPNLDTDLLRAPLLGSSFEPLLQRDWDIMENPNEKRFINTIGSCITEEDGGAKKLASVPFLGEKKPPAQQIRKSSSQSSSGTLQTFTSSRSGRNTGLRRPDFAIQEPGANRRAARSSQRTMSTYTSSLAGSLSDNYSQLLNSHTAIEFNRNNSNESPKTECDWFSSVENYFSSTMGGGKEGLANDLLPFIPASSTDDEASSLVNFEPRPIEDMMCADKKEAKPFPI